MNPTTPQLTLAPPQSATARPVARRRGTASPDSPTWGETLLEIAPMIGAPVFYGPPVIVVVGPWLLLVLVLIGPFALLFTLLLGLAVAAGLLAVFAAVLASPYLLIRHLHARSIVHANPRALLHVFRSRRVSSGRLSSPQPKGVS